MKKKSVEYPMLKEGLKISDVEYEEIEGEYPMLKEGLKISNVEYEEKKK